MYTGVNILIILFLFSNLNLGYGDKLPSFISDACNRITNPENLKTSCCPGMDLLVGRIKNCIGDAPAITSCSQATCVVESYGVLTDGKLDLKKVELVMLGLDVKFPGQIPLNALTRKYCVQGNYTCFPAPDPKCETWQFVNCAFFAYRIACPIKYSNCDCDEIEDDVVTCKPFEKRYVRELYKGCSKCLVPPALRLTRGRRAFPDYIEYSKMKLL